MNLKKILTIVTVLIFSLPIRAQSKEFYPGGKVTLPYADFEEIYKKLKEKEWEEKHPPKEAILTSARYQARIAEKSTHVTATLKVMVLKERDWVALPVLPSSLAIRNAQLDGRPARLYTEGGRHFLASDSTGEHTLEVEFALKSGHQESSSLSIPVLPTPTTELRVELPLFAGNKLVISPAQSQKVSQVGDKTVVEALIPATNIIQINWKQVRTVESKLPPKLFANVATLLSIGEGVIRQESLIEYSILQAPIDSLTLTIPEGFNVLAIGGADLKDWKVSPDKEGVQKVVVRLNEVHQGTYVLRLKGEVVLSGPSAKGNVPEIALTGVEREKGHIGIAATTNVEIITEGIKGSINRVDVQEIPRKIWNLSANPLLIGFKYLKHPYEVSLDIQKHKDVPSLVAAADSANGLTVCAESGDCITRVTFKVRNNLKQFVKIQLPKKAEFWGAFVSEKAVKAGWNKEKELLVPLEKSRGDYDEATSFPLELIYYEKRGGFWPLGARTYPLPLTDISVSRLDWSFYFPKNLHFAKFGGTLNDKREAWRLFPWSGKRVDQFLPPPAPVGGSYKEELAAEAEDRVMARKMAAPQGIIMKQTQQANIFLGEIQEAMTAGVLPVRIDLPKEGNLYTFSQLFIGKDRPILCAAYFKLWIQCLLTLALFGAFFYLKMRGLTLWQSGLWKKMPLQNKLIYYGSALLLFLLAYSLYLSSTAIWLGLIAGVVWAYRAQVKNTCRQMASKPKGFLGFSGLAPTARTILLVLTGLLFLQGILTTRLMEVEFWLLLIVLGIVFAGISGLERLLVQRRKTA